MKKSSCLTPVFTKALLALLFMLALIFNFISPALATTFTKTVPGTSLTIPSTYPEAGGVVIVLTGANGNVYYQFIQPSSMFVGYQNTGTPAAWRGNPFQIGPVMALNCGAVTTCSTYLGGSITSMAIRFTALDGDNKSGDFDFNDLTLRINGTDVGNWSTVATETTNTAGTSASGSGLGFGNNTLDTGWFQTTNTTLLSNVLSTGNVTATVFDRDPNDNYWDFRSGNDANTGTVPLNVAPGVTLDKAVNPVSQTTFLTVGQVVNYTYAYRNIGSVYVENIAVSDNKIATVTCPATPARLNPGETKTCTGSYTVTQADVDAGSITNIATATGTPQAGTLGPVTDTVTITGPAAAPQVNLTKAASPSPFGAVGSSVSYTFQVNNPGNVTLNSIVITDPLLPSLSCTVPNVGPGLTVSATCTGNTKTVTQADFDANSISNTASVSAKSPAGATVTDPTPPTVVITGPARTPGIALRKIATTITDTNGNGRLDAGDTQNYDLVVTNTGNVTLTSVTVTDPGAVVTGGPLASLAPGVVNSTTFKAARVITLAQMNAGVINNQASVTSTPPAGVAGPTTDLSHPTNDGANANTVTPLTRAPAVTLAKTATQTTYNAIGNTINYSYLVRNTGNVTLTVPITIADNKIPAAGITCPAFPAGGVAPNGTFTCSGVYTIVQADLDAGKVTNIASASSGTVATPVVTSPTDTVTVNASVSPGVTITKAVGTIADTNTSGRTDVGDTVTYVITVANTGNVTLNAVTVSDPLPGATVTGSPLASLNAGTSNSTIRVNYVLTQADVNAGKVDNQAAVTANPPIPAAAVTDLSDPTSGTANSTTTTTVPQVRLIALIKQVGTVADTNSSGRVDAGDILSNTIQVRNTGTVTLTGIVVTDPKAGVTLTGANVGTLLPGATSTGPITATYTLTQADIDAGTVQNQAAVSGTPPSGAVVTDTSHPASFTINSPTISPLTTTGSIAVVKTAGAPTIALGALSTVTDAGDRITYSFTVTNTGAQTLNTVGVADPKLTGITCAATTLAPNASTTCSAAPYTLTLADVNAGSVTNQATASGTRPGGAVVTDLSGSTNANNTQTLTPIAATPRIALIKTGGAPTIALGGNAAVTDPGDTISYSFTATNTGSVTLNSLAVTDPKVSGIVCAATTLAPGISTTCSGSPYVLTLADLNAGQVENQANATALAPSGSTSDASDPASQTGNAPTQTPVTQTPRIALLKVAGAIIDANSNGRTDAGDRIPYTFTVTNTGTVTLTNIRVADPQISVAGAAIVSLAPGASNTTNFTAVRVLTQADIDAGNYTNQAVVTAVSPSGPITDNSDPASNGGNAPTVVTIAPVGELSLAKTANISSFNAPGTTIAYSYEVTNTGTVTLSQPFTVADNKTAASCPATPATLGPTQFLICTASYITTQADVDAGGVTNIASAASGSTTSPNDSVTVPSVRTPTMAVVKSTVAPVTGLGVGDIIDYEYEITNTGNVTLAGPFTINDNRISAAAITCPPGNIAVGNNIVCAASYTITGDDVLVGVVTNTATASNAQTTSPLISLTIPNNAMPALELDKIAITSGFDAAGDIVTYEYTVVNSGNTDFVRFIDIIDNKAGTFTCIKATTTDPFKRGQKSTCSVNYTVSQADVDAGFVTNDAVAQTLFGASTPVASNPDTATVNAAQDPSIRVTKTASSSITGVGQILTYRMRVLNDGNVTVSNIVITDPLIPSLSCTIASLAPTISDNSCTGTYTVRQADIDEGQVLNTVTSTGVTPQGTSVTDTGSLTLIAPAANPSLSLDKVAEELSFDSIGQDLIYNFTVRNTGNVTLTNVRVTDPLVPAFLCVIPVLAPGNTDNTTCFTTYRVTQADVDNGSITNTASVTGTPARGTPPTATDSVTTGGPVREPRISIVKSTASAPSAAGQTLNYRFEVSNSGNVNITGVTVTDPKCAAAPVKVSGDTGNDNILGITEVHVYTCTSIAVIQAQVDAGIVSNTVTANGTSIVGPAPTVTSSLNTPVTSSPAITLVKSASAPTTNLGANTTTVDAGDRITYSFTLANAGNVTLNPVSVTDAKLGIVTCAATSLAPGVSTSCTAAAYTITQADMDAGNVTNTATGRGKPPTGADTTDVSGSSTTNNTPTVTTLAPAPAITLVKTAGAPSINLGTSNLITDAGDRITYSFTVRNAGTVTLNPVSVTDVKLGTVTCVATTLAPGVSTTCSAAVYTITQADMDAGIVTNTATATGKPPTGANVTDVSGTLATNNTPTTRVLPQSPIVRLTKIAASPSVNLGANTTITDAGDTIAYTFNVRNSGSVTLTTISVTDPKVANIVCVATTLAPATQTTCTGSAYIITQADMDSGSAINTANASAKPPTGANVTDISGTDFTNNTPTNTPLAGVALIRLVKTAGTPTVAAGANATATDAGDTITYSFTVSNRGTVTLNPVSVTDVKLGTVTCAATSLAPGVSTTCSAAAYTITLADMNAGSVNNTATASGTPPSGPAVTDVSGSAENNDTPTNTPLTQTPRLTLVKTAAAPTTNLGTNTTVTDAGDTITYSFTVANTGTVTLNPVSVADVKLGAITCLAISLAPGVSTTCSAPAYSITLADMNTGSVSNTATATGKPPTGADVTDVSGTDGTNNTPTDTPLTQTPSLTLVKTAGTPTVGLGANTTATDAGDTITYAFTARNSGTVTINPISVSDAKLGAITCAATSLAPGVSTNCSAPAYTITLADMNAGSVTNTATATGKPPIGADVTDVSGTDATNNTPTNTPLTQTPSLTLVKTAGTPTVNLGASATATDAGDTITYSFAVRNSGTVTLNSVSVSDVKLGTITCAATSLAPGVSTVCSAPAYTITLTDMNTGSVTNTANASGTPPTGPAVTDRSGTSPTNDDDTVAPLVAIPAVTLVKTAGVPTLNLGANSAVTDAGDTITYSFTVRNEGPVTLNPVSVSDVKLGTVTCVDTSLAPGDSTTCSAPAYTITLADMNNGSVSNTAVASGAPPTGPVVTDRSGTSAANDDDTVAPLTGIAAITLVKTAGTPTVGLGADTTATDEGDTISYSFTVRNAGTVTLNAVSVSDVKLGTITCTAASLAPGLSTTCSAPVYTITLADMNAGQVTNTATASGTPPTGSPVTDRSGSDPTNDTDTVTPLTATPRLTLVKTAGTPTANLGANTTATDAGDTITYAFTVRNSGTVTLDPVSVSDAKLGTVTCVATSLAPGISTNCSALAYTITLADMNAGSVTNTATATGVPPAILGLPDATDISGSDAANNTPTNTPLSATPSLTLVKTASVPTIAGGASITETDAGDTITYSFEVENTGTVTLDPVSVSDAKVGPVTCAATSLAPGVTTNCSAPGYIITLADMNAGKVENTATATGKPPVALGLPDATDVSGSDATNNTPTNTPLTQTPRLTLVKATGTASVALGINPVATDANDTISYSFTVRNAGNVSLIAIEVSDAKVANIVCGATTLAPGVSTTCAGDAYIITQADMDAGEVINTATGKGTPPTGLDVTDISGTSATNDTDTITPLTPTPRLTLVKTAGIPTINLGANTVATDAGDTITYSFEVANSGNVVLNPISVSDAKLGTITCAATSLAPGASTSCTAPAYVISLADMNAGSVTNTATATGTPPVALGLPNATDVSGSDVNNNNDTVTPITATPRLTLVKSAGTPTIAAGANAAVTDAGDTITYSFVVANTGTVTLAPVSVTDVKLGAITCTATSLAPGVSTNCSAPPYVITLADMNAGVVENTATATGAPPAILGLPNATDTSGTDAANNTPTATLLTATPSLTLVKTAAAPSVSAGINTTATDVGDTIIYSFAVTNNGTVTLDPVNVADAKVSNIVCDLPALAPGSSTTCTGDDYVISLVDMNTGSVTNTATATGVPPAALGLADATDVSGTSATNDTATVTPLTGTARLTLVKTSSAPTVALGADSTATDAGDTITYTFAVANTGTVTLNSVSVSDVKLGVITCAATSLAPNASTTCSAPAYIITLADMNTGSVTNTAIATGTPPTGPDVTDRSGTNAANDNDTFTPLSTTPRITLVKTAGAPTVAAGANPAATDAGDTITYGFTVANIGGVTLNPVTISDAKVANIICAATSLAPGDNTTCAGDPYVITLDDMNAGSVTNTALGTGTPPTGPAVTDTSGTTPTDDTPTLTGLTATPSLTLVKTAGAPSVDRGANAAVTDAGDIIAYSFVVTNTGSVTLNPVSVSDAKVSNIICAATSLAPGNATTCAGNPYVLTQADMDAGSTTNTAIATGTPPTGDPVTDTSGTTPTNDTPTQTPLTGVPSLTLFKSAGAPTIDLGANSTFTDAGDQINYSFRVINNGPVTVNSIIVSDAKVANITCAQTSLAAGAETQCTGNPYTITDADVTALRIVNTANVTGLAANGIRASDVSDDPADLANVDTNGNGDPDDKTVLVLAAPPVGDITMQKTASVSTAKTGDVVVYTLKLTNSQAFAAGPLSVVDTLPQGFNFVEGSATSEGAAVIPVVAGRTVTFSTVTVPANSSLSLRLSVRVGNVSSGAFTNRVRAFDSTGAPVSNEATATVRVSGEAVFDCGDIIGKVYDDKNRNNIQEKGEPGMPGVRLATVRGVLITTDEYGRYNVPCAELPDPDIGSNFILKLDPRTLPSGYVVITENPRDVRMTAGKLTKLNFGVAQARVLKVELTSAAFEQGNVKPSEKLEKGIESLVEAAREELSVIQLTYVLKSGEPRKRAEERLKTVSDEIRTALKKAGLRAKTPVETKIITR